MSEQLLFVMPQWGLISIYTLVGIVLTLLLSKTILGWVWVPSYGSGLVEKKWSLAGDLPNGRFIATKGEAGIEAALLAPGLHFFKWWWMYKVYVVKPIEIQAGKIGVVKAENGQPLPSGSILSRTTVACDNFQDGVAFLENGGVMGVQANFLRNGVYRINTKLFTITEAPVIGIRKEEIGIVTTLDGERIQTGEIASKEGTKHPSFQDADIFLNNGGKRGLQEEILPPGQYFINPQFARVEPMAQTKVPIGHVGVVTMFIGDNPVDTSGTQFKHGIIVSNGQKGVQQNPLNPGMYPLNTKVCAIEIVPTTNIVLNWANAKTESHELDSHLSTITARTRDGFAINLDVSQIINIAHDEAPKVIARFGTLKNLISQVLEPTIGNYFRNSVQASNAIDFIVTRKERQEEAKAYINTVLDQYNVVGVDTLIGDIVPPEPLLEPIRRKHIADQTKMMFDQQRLAEIARKELENAMAEADMQKEVVQSEREISIAENHANAVVKKQEGDSKAIELKAGAEAAAEKQVGFAKAEVIEKQGEATAIAYKKQVDAMGQGGFTSLQVAKELSSGKLQLVPQIMTGNGGGAESLLGLMALKHLGVDLEPER